MTLVADVDVVLGLVVEVGHDNGAHGVGPAGALRAARHQDAGGARLEVTALPADLHGVVDAEVHVIHPLAAAGRCGEREGCSGVKPLVVSPARPSVLSNIPL